MCSMTNGCYAANIHGNDDITCELTSGLSNEGEMLHDSTKTVYIRGKMVTLEFFINGAELLVNSVNSGNLINH